MSDEQTNPSQEPSSTEAAAPPVVTRTRGSRTRKAATPAPEIGAVEPDQAAEPTEPTAPAEGAASTEAAEPAKKAPAKRAAAKKAPAKKAAAKKAPAKRAATKKTAAASDAPLDFAADAVTADGVDEVQATGAAESAVPDEDPATAPAAAAPTVTRTTRTRGTRRTAKTAQPAVQPEAPAEDPEDPESSESPVESAADDTAAGSVEGSATMPLFQAPEKKAPARRTRKRAAAPEPDAAAEPAVESAATQTAEVGAAEPEQGDAPPPAVKRTRRSTRKAAAPQVEATDDVEPDAVGPVDVPDTEPATVADVETEDAETDESGESGEPEDSGDDNTEDSSDDNSEGGGRRRRRRGGRRRRRSGDDTGAEVGSDNSEGDGDDADSEVGAPSRAGRGGGRGGRDAEGSRAAQGTGPAEAGEADSDDQDGDGSSRRRRRRRRGGDSGGDSSDDPDQTVTRVRRPRNAEDEITSLAGSTRLEAKKQRRREGREAGRRRAPIVSEAEFLARRESVDRTMVIRQRDELTQIAVLEDKVLVEHYVARESQTSLIGNVYLGRVQNVLPSMEAAFIDIGKGRNAVLYAGEVNWSSLGHREGQPRKIESVLSSGQPILVQVTKDPIGHKGARLSSQVSLAGRFLVYVPDGTTSGISRKLPDTERNRLKTLLKEIVPESAGVIVRTAAEGASEAELTQDVERLKARWEDIEAKSRGNAPQLLYGEPDLTLKVVRDLFTEDFAKLVIQGDDAWDTVQGYVEHVAPDLAPRLERYEVSEHSGTDLFATYRVDEQIAKGLDRKVWLPSGGSLVIDRTEAMTVVDVNTGKFTGSGGNLEETVTKNNLEAAEEIVRQLRLRDIGGIIVVDFIDMVLESNRDLVLRRLVECLGRDRTRHQVAEVTSLGLVQMTRKRIGTGLLEAFGEDCASCHGRGVIVHDHPIEQQADDDHRRGSGGSGGSGQSAGRGRGRGGRGRGQDDAGSDQGNGGGSGGGSGGGNGSARPPAPVVPSPKLVAAIARPENADVVPLDERTGQEDDPVAQVAAAVTAQVTPEVAPVSVPVQVVEPVQTPEAAAPAEAAGEPAAAQQDAEAEAEARFPDEQPRVVTRARRRSATRPAGPPEGAVGTVVSLDPEAASAGDVVDGGDVPVVEHVPVKRKGTRKR